MLLFLGRLIKHTARYLFVCLPLELVGIVLLGIIIPLNLKVPLWYTNYHNEGPEAIGLEPTKWNTYVWLAWRNPLNYFQYAILGWEYPGSILLPQAELHYIGNTNVGDDSAEGFLRIEAVTWGDKSVSYEYYYIKAYTIFGQRKCIRFRMGHKLKNLVVRETAQWVLVFNPVMGYSGV